MKKKDFEAATGITVSDAMFEFSVVVSRQKENFVVYGKKDWSVICYIK